MRNQVSIFVCVVVLNLVGNISDCHGGDYKLSIDMNAALSSSAVKTNLSLARPAGAPFSVAEFNYYSIGLDVQRPHFAKPPGQENTHNSRFTHTIGVQRRIAGTGIAIGVYSCPVTRGHSTPFGEAPSQVTNQSLQQGGVELAYIF